MKYFFLLIIKFYQFFISPWVRKNCKYSPTCSEYIKESIHNHHFIKALFLSIKRILRCHPFSKGGYDPVPTVDLDKIKARRNKRNL